uniref:B30.2/SPRY domain-containing protein n=2 Tax=Eptatretus burgeri TaxID=7764 RepID=A0A8C4PXG4_EPTBU
MVTRHCILILYHFINIIIYGARTQFKDVHSSPTADHVKDRGDEMEEFGIFPIKVEDLQSDGLEDVGREETQMMGMLAAQCPQVLNSMQDLGSELQELQQEFEQTQHSDRDTVDRLEGKRRHLYQFVDEAVDLVKIRVNKKQKEKFYLLDKQMECLQQAKSTRQRALQGREDISCVQGYMDLGKKGLESASQFQSMKISLFSVLDISQEEKNLDLLIQLNSNPLQKIQNGESLNLDPNSAHPLIVISQDLKTATRTGTKHLHSEHPDRFNVYPQVLSSECFSFGHHYWEVDVSLSHWCRIGVAFHSLGRKGTGKRCGLGENHESWCIEKYHNEYSAWHNDQETPLSVWGDLERFGFLLDCEVGELMCFGDSRVLHVFKGTFTDPIKAAIGVYNYVGDSVRFCSL